MALVAVIALPAMADLYRVIDSAPPILDNRCSDRFGQSGIATDHDHGRDVGAGHQGGECVAKKGQRKIFPARYREACLGILATPERHGHGPLRLAPHASATRLA